MRHRVNEICNLSGQEQWKFCPGRQNPADLPSRGCSGEEFASNMKWWKRTTFLQQPLSSWPILPTLVSTPEAGKELMKHPPVLIHSLIVMEADSTVDNLGKVIDITRYSSKIKLLRVTATVIKFAQFWRKKGKVPQSWTPTEITDLTNAKERWIQAIQRNCFSEELKLLKSGRNSSNRLINQLNLGLNQKGFIRCQGRINGADVPEGSKNPLLLPTRHRFKVLLILSIHCQIFCNGIREILNAVRERYWIVRGREVVKQVIR